MAFPARRVMRRRAVARTAMVGGAAYYAGKKGAQSAAREADEDARIADLEAQGAQAPPPAAAPPPPAASQAAASNDTVEQLTKLAALRDQGVLTDEEFAAQKAKILGG